MKDSSYKDCIALWFDFYEKKEGIKPKMTGIEGKALKQMIVYLKTLGEGDAVANFNAILMNWHVLESREKWYKGKYDIKFINSQLNQIIRILKNGRQDHKKAFDSLR